MGEARILRKCEARAKVDRRLWQGDPDTVEEMLHADLVRYCTSHDHLMVGEMRVQAFDPLDSPFPDLCNDWERDLVTVIAQCLTAVRPPAS